VAIQAMARAKQHRSSLEMKHHPSITDHSWYERAGRLAALDQFWAGQEDWYCDKTKGRLHTTHSFAIAAAHNGNSSTWAAMRLYLTGWEGPTK